jgi:hypothetical protein
MYGMTSIRVLLIVLAGLFSAFASWFGLMAWAWGGTGWPDVPHILLWLFPLVSLAAFALFFIKRKTGLLASWLLFLGSALAVFIGNWSECSAGKCTTTNPVLIAAGTFAVPHIWILLIAASCLQIAWKIEKTQARNKSSEKSIAN